MRSLARRLALLSVCLSPAFVMTACASDATAPAVTADQPAPKASLVCETQNTNTKC